MLGAPVSRVLELSLPDPCPLNLDCDLILIICAARIPRPVERISVSDQPRRYIAAVGADAVNQRSPILVEAIDGASIRPRCREIGRPSLGRTGTALERLSGGGFTQLGRFRSIDPAEADPVAMDLNRGAVHNRCETLDDVVGICRIRARPRTAAVRPPVMQLTYLHLSNRMFVTKAWGRPSGAAGRLDCSKSQIVCRYRIDPRRASSGRRLNPSDAG